MPDSQDYTLTDSLYLFKKKQTEFYSISQIRDFFRDIRRNKKKRKKNLFCEINRLPTGMEVITNTNFRISAFCFPFEEKVTFLHESCAPSELKYAHLCLLDFGDYVAIAKSNVTLPKSFSKTVDAISQNVLSHCFLRDGTKFETISTTSMSRSETAIRNKRFSANDLSQSLPATGNSSDAIRSLRVINSEERLGLTLNTSRINGYARSVDFADFVQWVYQITKQVKAYQTTASNDFLNCFAASGSYRKESANLHPIGLVIMWDKLYRDIDSHIIEDIKRNDESILTDFKSFPNSNYEMLKLTSTSFGIEFVANHEKYGKLSIIKGQNQISLRCAKMTDYILHCKGGEQISLCTYLNRNDCFIVYFQESCKSYHAKTLYTDAKLPVRLEHFLDVFEPLDELATVTSEKGRLTSTSTEFEEGSEFRLIENRYANQYDYFICDDLGTEWADHIGISHEEISFFASKYHNLPPIDPSSKISISNLHIVVAQAQKNLAFLTPTLDKLNNKKGHWKKLYGSTQIPHLRRGDSVENAVKLWESTIQRPGVRLEMYIVINSLSKDTVKQHFQKFRETNGGNAQDLNPAILQLVWLIAGLYTACQTHHTKLHILCRP